MSFQAPITIEKAVKNIHERRYLLPSIQRELVWDTGKIEMFFDSILRGYPFGSLLFWTVERKRAGDYQFYEFVREYHELKAQHNAKADIAGENDFTAVLDGQQRLTALYIGLRGSYSERGRYKRKGDSASYPPKRLHLNLTRKLDAEEKKFDVRFLTVDDLKEDKDNHWFQVGSILDFTHPKDVAGYLERHGLKGDFAAEALHQLRKVIVESPVVHFYLEEDPDPDRVLNIFIRVNSAGTPLGYSDLLMSIATALWKGNARDIIHGLVDDLNKIGQGFDFDKDFVLKSSLVLADIQDIRYSVANFNRKNVETIEKEWASIAGALRSAVQLVANFGLNKDALTSHNAIIPIAYYLRTRGLGDSYILRASDREDRDRVRRWLLTVLLKGTFGSQVDNVLRSCRTAIRAMDGAFPTKALEVELLRLNMTLRFEEQEISDLTLYRYGQRRTFAILSLLYPTLNYRNRFHQDHIHPKSIFHRKKLLKAGVPEEAVSRFKDLYDNLANLQLLEGIPNQEKSDQPFGDWMEKCVAKGDERDLFCRLHYIPKTDWDIKNFDRFYEMRRGILIRKLKDELGLSISEVSS